MTTRSRLLQLPVGSRHRAREAALQMLYEWEVGRVEMAEVVQTFPTLEQPDTAPVEPDVCEAAGELAQEAAARVADIDPLIEASADNWRLSRMAAIDRAILRLAVCEFICVPETPRAVVIDEAIELARTFSADEAVKFINGVLDAIRKKLDV